MITTIVPTTRTRSIGDELLSLLKDWEEVYKLTGYGEFEIVSILYMLGGVK